jgi:tripeptidyl-peptidase-2
MNGTSMSSPNCAGCVALLLSACKQANIPYTSSRVRSAIMNTAKSMPKLSTLVQGAGMIQVCAAYEHLVKHKGDSSLDVLFQPSIDRVATPRGVYLRQPEETRKKQTYNVTVDPRFFPEGVEGTELATQQARVNFEMKLNLKLQDTQLSLPRDFDVTSCISHPEHRAFAPTRAPLPTTNPNSFALAVMLPAGGRSFAIEVDPTSLEPGLYTTTLVGYDSTSPDKGAVFRLPITIVKPNSLPPNEPSPNLGQMNFGPAETYVRERASEAGASAKMS